MTGRAIPRLIGGWESALDGRPSRPASRDAVEIKPLWRRIFEFPLVAMVLSLIAVIVAVGVMVGPLMARPASVEPAWLKEALVSVAMCVGAVAALKLVVSRLGETPRDDLPLDARANDLWRGATFAAILMSAIVGIVALLGGYRIAGWGGSTSWPMLLFTAGLQAAFVEEILFRGVLFRFLEDFGGSWFALAFSSAAFGLAHGSNANATLFSSLAIAVEAGILLGGAYMLTRSLWLAVGIHFGWNVAQGYLWDVPVSGFAVDGMLDSRATGPDLISGGAFGVEASVVALVLATALGAWFVVLAARRGQLVRPWWVRRRLARSA